MKNDKSIKSEFYVIISIIVSILLLPITLILVLLGNKRASELLRPIHILKDFLLESKLVLSIAIINIIVYFTVLFYQDILLEYFIMYPTDIISSRIYTIITAGFMHGSISHLIGNIIALLLIGRIVAREFGNNKTLIIYFSSMIIAGIISSIIFMARGMDTGSLGASGAIMGLVGIAIIYRPLQISFLLGIPLPLFIIGWLYIISDIIGLTGQGTGINHIAHIAGMIGAVGVAGLLMPEEKDNIKRGIIMSIVLGIIAVIIYLIALI
ncbi:MAG: rhomboid family intramembrane serine protease [Candidatus Woesearchaeota archaeon]